MEARIDKWLWAARIFKTRSIAADACKNGRVTIGGVCVKPSRSGQRQEATRHILFPSAQSHTAASGSQAAARGL